MNINAQDSFLNKSEESVKADAFLKPIYRPKNDETRKTIRDFLTRLGLPVTDKYVDAMTSAVVAVKKADAKGSNRIAYPGDSGYYTKGLYGRGIAVAVRDRLIERGHLTPITQQRRGRAIVYEATGFDFTGDYTSSEPLPVRVRESKETWEKKGKSIPRSSSVKRFRSKFTAEEKRIERLNEAYASHPLTSSTGLSWGAAFRGYNEGRMDRGGRLYGDWQQLEPEERLKLALDGEPVVEIDIVASFLFIVSAKGGSPIVAQDPYADIDWVKKDKTKRKLAKRLVSAFFSKDGHLKRFPGGVRGEFPCIPKKAHIDGYRDPILRIYPQIDPPAVSGMQAMFLESEVVITTTEALMAKGVVAYPVHDCLLVAEKHKDKAIIELWKQMDARFEAKPWLKVTYCDGREEFCDPT